jgi:hypothetical protein
LKSPEEIATLFKSVAIIFFHICSAVENLRALFSLKNRKKFEPFKYLQGRAGVA